MPGQFSEVPKMPAIWTDFDTYQYGYVSDAGFTGSVNACEINCYKANAQVARTEVEVNRTRGRGV